MLARPHASAEGRLDEALADMQKEVSPIFVGRHGDRSPRARRGGGATRRWRHSSPNTERTARTKSLKSTARGEADKALSGSRNLADRDPGLSHEDGSQPCQDPRRYALVPLLRKIGSTTRRSAAAPPSKR
jgi:hypothetical protein